MAALPNPRSSGVPVLKQGSIFILPDCPPLHGEKEKNRPVIILTPPSILKSTNLDVIVLACSTSVPLSVKTKIALPNRSSEPQTKSGLNEPCWAVLDWRVRVTRERFIGLRQIGYISGKKLAEVIGAYLEIAAKPLNYR